MVKFSIFIYQEHTTGYIEKRSDIGILHTVNGVQCQLRAREYQPVATCAWECYFSQYRHVTPARYYRRLLLPTSDSRDLGTDTV